MISVNSLLYSRGCISSLLLLLPGVGQQCTLGVIAFGVFLGPHLYWANIITEFISVLFVSIKAAMDLLSIAILLQLRCVYFYCPVNRAQARAAFMDFVLGGERKT